MLLRFRVRALLSVLIVATTILATSCGGGSASSPAATGATVPTNSGGGGTTATASASSTVFERVVIVVLENQSYSSVVGSSSMPYFNSLAQHYGLASNDFANAHPSLPNYFMLTTGQTVTMDDNFAGTVSDDNVVRELTAAGKTWKAYMEDLPAVGYTGGDAGSYVKHHNPFAYLSDVLSGQQNGIVPFTQFGADVVADRLPQYSFISPSNAHNSHDCPSGGTSCSNAEKLAAADAWLQANIAPLIASASFQRGGLLIITFDEADITDTAMGGGKVATVVVAAKSKAGFVSTTTLQHQSILRLMLNGLGVTAVPGAAASAPPMSEYFQ